MRTGYGLSSRRTTVSATASRASSARASKVSAGPCSTQRIIQR
ncbi:Uncharacterised protein [Mycobacteroides abscessus subsp. abscessus]|nr:Uncharacterised protein [Mycobacteroides abscessus subsp. abscessus]